MAQEQYPAVTLLERFIANAVPMTTASDAHSVDRVSERMDDLVAIATRSGITELASFEGRLRTTVPLKAID